MEYYDITNIGDVSYYDIIEKPVRAMRMKLELLDHFENCIGSIEQDIDSSSAGSIVVNNEQGCQRSCSFTLINVDEKYTIDENNFFWFNRKFKLYLGLTDYKNTFWFTKGVFITSDASCDSTAHTVSINAVDKYAQLNGDLNVLQMDEMDTVFEIGTNIEECVKDILLLDMGNGFVLDPIEPIIDPDIAKQTLYREFTMSAGSYFGDFFTEIATCFGCDIFYDALGRLVITRVFNDDIPYWYAFKSPAHKFDRNIHGYISPSLSTQMNGVNKIIVSTDNTDCANATYTAINHNPRSPLCYDKIGARTLPENGGIITINAGDPAEGTVEKRCKDYAEYRMIKETCMALKVTFNTIPLLHLNRGDVISITDPQFGLNGDGFIVDSITYPLDTGEISIEATNLKYLNTDIYIDSQYTEIREITYSVSYNLNGGDGYVGSTLVPSSVESFTADNGYSSERNEDTFSKEGYEFTYWLDNDNEKYFPDSTYNNPYTNLRLKANWVSVPNDRIFRMVWKNKTSSSNIEFNKSISGNTNDDTVDALWIGDKKYYFRGRGYNRSSVTAQVPAFEELEIVGITTNGTYDLSYLMSNATKGYTYSVKFPDAITEIKTSTTLSNKSALNYINLPKGLTSFLTKTSSSSSATSDNWFYNLSDTQEIVFENENPLTVSGYATTASQSTYRYFIYNCPALEKVWFKNSVTISNTATTSGYMTLGEISADIIIDGDLTINNCNFYTGFSSSATSENTIEISGTLTTASSRSGFCNGANCPNTIVRIGNVAPNGGIINGSTLKSVEVSGEVNLTSGGMLGGVSIIGNVVLGNVTNAQSTLVSGSVAGVVKVENLTNTGSFMGGMSGVTELIIRGNVVHGASAQTVLSCNALTTVHIVGSVDVTLSSANFISGNSNLTDIYLYSDNFTIDSSAIQYLFQGNNANLKIHGIAGGTVQSIAQTLNIPFVELTQEEIEGADDL